MKKYITILLIAMGLFSCSDLLEEEVFTEVASNNFFQNDEDAQKAIYALYAKLRSDGPVTADNGQREGWGFYGFGEGSIFNLNQTPTDEMYVQWEADGGFWRYLEHFEWIPDAGSHFDVLFADLYEGIAIANNIIGNINNSGISEEVQNQVMGEALMARGLFYSTAYSFYENIPLILESVSDPLSLPMQAKPNDVVLAIIEDLTDAVELLPVSWSADGYGRFTKGSALATLARFQLNQHNWEAARNAAQDLVDLNMYSLSDGYADAFSVNNSGNSEIILSIPCIAQPGVGNTIIAHTAEADFVPGGWGGHLVRNEFYETFDADDTRKSYLVKDYTSITGAEKTKTLGYMFMKYEVDPGRVGSWASNDIVVHRYAEIVLTLAEALNEIEGPNQESIDLINQLRARAFNNDATKLIQLSDFSSKVALRDHILAERGWELYTEGYRRDDLIRHGKFISKALDRGVIAEPHHVLFPIPQVEIDKNPNLIQNKGYEL